MVLAILISCVLVGGLGYVFTTVPLMPVNMMKDLEVEGVYRIESTVGNGFYMRYKMQNYDYCWWNHEISYPDDKSVRVDFRMKKPVFSRKSLGGKKMVVMTLFP